MTNHPNRQHNMAHVVHVYDVTDRCTGAKLEVLYDWKTYQCGFRLVETNGKSMVSWFAGGMMPGLAMALNKPIPESKEIRHPGGDTLTLEQRVACLEKRLGNAEAAD